MMMLDSKTRIRTIDCIMIVSFKKRRSGRLLNIEVDSLDICEASRKANAYVQKHYPNKGYREYGISHKTAIEREYTVTERLPVDQQKFPGQYGSRIEWRQV